MIDLQDKLRHANNDTSINSSILCCKYGLLDICFVKLITYFYHFDKKVKKVKAREEEETTLKTGTVSEVLGLNKGAKKEWILNLLNNTLMKLR